MEDMSCSPVMPLLYLSFLFQLSVVSHYWGLFRLTAHSLRKDVASLCKLCCCCCQLPERLMRVVWRAKYWVLFPLFTVISAVTFLCPAHEQEQCWAALISMYTIILLFFVAPVVISSTVDFINAKQGSQQQQPKRHDMIIVLIVLVTFILNIWNFLQQLGYIPVPPQVVFLLACIHRSIKPFIYFLVGRYRRPCTVDSLQLSLQSVFEEQKEITPCRNYAPGFLKSSTAQRKDPRRLPKYSDLFEN